MRESSTRGFLESIAKDLANRTNATIAGLLALAGITGLAGGFDAAPPEGFVSVVAPAGVNPLTEPATLHVDPFDLEVTRTYIHDGARVVEMRVTNTTTRPILAFDFMRVFQLKDSTLPDDEQPEFLEKFYRIKEPSEGPFTPGEYDIFGDLLDPNPGVTLDVAMMFYDPLDNPGSEQAVAADTLFIEEYKFKKSALDGTMMWLPGELSAEVVLK